MPYHSLEVGPLVINFLIHKYGACCERRCPALPLIRIRPKGTPHGHNGPPQIELDRFVCACVVVQQMSGLYDRCRAGRADGAPMEVSRDDFLLAILRLP